MKGGRLAILGAGGHGRVVADTACEAGWGSIEFFDDVNTGRSGRWLICGTGTELLAKAVSYDGVVVAIGNNAARLAWIDRLVFAHAHLASIIHPQAIVSRDCEISAGTIVMAGAVLNFGVRMGRACIINSGAIVDHDTILGDAVHVSPGATLSGNVRVGSLVWIGAGATVKNDVVIDDETLVGLGSAVVRNVARGTVVAGVPAKVIKAKANEF